MGLLVVQAVRDPDTPPQLSAQTTGIVERADGYVVQGEVVNTGGTAASNVEVEGRLFVDGGMVEEEGRLVVLPTGFIEQSTATAPPLRSCSSTRTSTRMSPVMSCVGRAAA